jgi:hypothetical protein
MHVVFETFLIGDYVCGGPSPPRLKRASCSYHCLPQWGPTKRAAFVLGRDPNRRLAPPFCAGDMAKPPPRGWSQSRRGSEKNRYFPIRPSAALHLSIPNFTFTESPAASQHEQGQGAMISVICPRNFIFKSHQDVI